MLSPHFQFSCIASSSQFRVDFFSMDAQHCDDGRNGQKRRQEKDAAITKHVADGSDQQSACYVSSRVERLVAPELPVKAAGLTRPIVRAASVGARKEFALPMMP